MKKLLLIITLITASLSWGQYEILSIDVDNNNFCAWDYKSYVVTVKHNGFGAPTMITTATSTNQGLLDIAYNNSNAYTDTIEFYVDVFDGQNWVGPGLIEDDTLEFSFLSSLGAPIPALDTLIELTVNGEVDVSFDFAGADLCTNGQPFDLNDYAASPGGDYDWIEGQSNIFDPRAYFDATANTGVALYYDFTNANGCNGFAEESFDLNIAPTASVVTTPSNCGSAIGDATVSITSGTATGMMEVYWSTGFLDAAVSTTSIISNLSSGVYYANVTDGLGCKAVGTAQVGDVDIVVTDVILPATCAGMSDGSIDLTITTGGNVTQTFWSNGVTTADMTGHAGEYTIEIHTDNNCNAFGTYIIPESPIMFELDAGYPLNSSCAVADGSANITVSGGTGNLNVVWSSANLDPFTQVANNLTAARGFYTCIITDDNGCNKAWDVTIPSYNNIDVFVNEITPASCGNSDGSVNVNVNDWGGFPIANWEWSNGSTDEDLVNVPSGDYTLEFENASGCVSNLSVTVPVIRPYQPQICLLTVDTSLVYNEIVWEKDPNNIVDGFNIYRETGTFGVFELVTSQPYVNESVYIDNAASPVDRSWRYFITSYDACSESYGSFIHKTIHIVEVSNNGTDVGIAWDDYEGITYSSIDLMRFDDVNGWQNVANLPIGTNTYTDTPPEMLGLDYMISFNLATPCTSTKAQDHNTSRSNTSSSTFIGGDPTDLSVIEKEDGKIMLYPNPTSDNLNIFIENSDDYDVIRIVNINGELVYTQTISESLNQISTYGFAKGIYFVQIYSENGIVTEKIVKQ